MSQANNSCFDASVRSGPQRPVPTVDIVIFEQQRGVVLVRRRFEPLGWALPGGFVDYGESVEDAARREALEETGLTVTLASLLGVYSDPLRDARLHTISVVFTAKATDFSSLKGGDDAAEARFFHLYELPSPLAFDHANILADFRKSGLTAIGGSQGVYWDKKFTATP